MKMRAAGKARRTIRTHMFSLLFLVSLLFVACVALAIGIYELENARAQNEIYFQNTVNATNAQLDGLISELDVVACQIIADTDLQEVISRANRFGNENENYFERNVTDRIRAQSILWTYCAPRQTARQIHVFTDSDYVGMSYSTSNALIREQAKNEKWDVAPRTIRVLSPHYDDWTLSASQRRLVFSVVRCLVRTVQPFDVLGHIEVQQDYSRIASICDPINLRDYELFVFDETGAPVYPYATAETDYLDVLPQMTSNEISRINYRGEHYIGLYDKSALTGWTVLLMQNRSLFNAGLRRALFVIIAVGALLLAVLSIVFYRISRGVSRPLEELIHTVETFPLKQFEPIPRTADDYREIGILKDSFEAMMQRVQESNQQLIAAAESELRLKINELQAKINPHFLYNSLALIAAAGAEAGCASVEEMCCQLSDIFRYVSVDEPRQVTLTEEIRHVQTYLNFMKWRFEDNFEYECTTQGDLDSHIVNRLVFQPLIENCFRYGFHGTEPPFKVRIRCEVEECGWSFCVEDNGTGFSDDALERLHRTFAQMDAILKDGKNYHMLQPSNMAIVNIYLRLRLLYHEDTHIFIGNGSDLGGAYVTITVKKNVMGEDK